MLFRSFFLNLCILRISSSQLNFQSPGNWFRELYRWKNTLNASKSNIQMHFPFYWICATHHVLNKADDGEGCSCNPLWRPTQLTLSFTTQFTWLPIVWASRCVYAIWCSIMCSAVSHPPNFWTRDCSSLLMLIILSECQGIQGSQQTLPGWVLLEQFQPLLPLSMPVAPALKITTPQESQQNRMVICTFDYLHGSPASYSKHPSSSAGATEALLSLPAGWEPPAEQQRMWPGETTWQSSAGKTWRLIAWS